MGEDREREENGLTSKHFLTWGWTLSGSFVSLGREGGITQGGEDTRYLLPFYIYIENIKQILLSSLLDTNIIFHTSKSQEAHRLRERKIWGKRYWDLEKKMMKYFTIISVFMWLFKTGVEKWCCWIREELRESLRWYRESPDYYFPQLGGHSQRRQSGEKEKCCSNFSVNFNMFKYFSIFSSIFQPEEAVGRKREILQQLFSGQK